MDVLVNAAREYTSRDFKMVRVFTPFGNTKIETGM